MVDQNRQGYNLSAEEILQLTGWPPAMIEDYLNITGDMTRVTNEINQEITNVTQIVEGVEQEVSGVGINRARIVKVARSLARIRDEIESLEDAQAELTGIVASLQSQGQIYFTKLRKRLSESEEEVSALLSNRQALSGRLRTVERDLPAKISTRALIGF